MSDASVPKDRRFPIGLTIATLVAFAILCGLGVWQLKRLAWKEDLLARIELLKTAPARPLAAVLAGKGDASWTRVSVSCAPGQPETLPLVYGVRDGDIVWRATAICRTPAAGYGAILLDLGVVKALTGQSTPAPATLYAPAQAMGVLIAPKSLGGDRAATVARFAADKPAPYILMVESATPAPPGITPAPLPAEISNRHLEYALTWFGLAVTLLFIYAAMLWRKMRS
ncbi:SURF1 family protein [Caulobacter rhizosphaerae]|jgi:surfeit locus 1 family protein|uniref:SURF1 family protein n=1 Tax=Caulobacter rhizosphaerae TaxID=2010972 RepID=UPI0013D43F51|nr:SURF1 family cytochrome oxidase biogenesis protein [Caulobacter rhizosphaerae]GGL31433.1 SURF1-like protein [Caulobacter rhizosphaerae]